MPRIEVEAAPVQDSTDAVAAGLYAFNAPHMHRTDPIPFNIILRDDNNRRHW